MSEIHALASLPQRTLEGWHRFVASGDPEILPPLLSEHIVFRSPFVHSPIPGRPATLLVLTTVARIFENFTYHRTFIAGAHDAALEFAANIGKWQLKGVDLIKFNDARRNDRIRGHDPPHQGAGRAGRGDGKPDRPAIEPDEGGSGSPALIWPLLMASQASPALARRGALWQGSARLVEAFSADSRIRGTLP